MRREQTGQIKDLAFQKPDGVHLDVVLEALFWWSSPGPLCRGGMGSTARGRRGSPYGRGKGGGGPRAASRGVGVVWRWLCDPLRPKGLSMAFSVLPLTSGPGSEASPIRLLRKRRVHDAPPCFSQRAWSGVVTVHLCQNPGIKNMMDLTKFSCLESLHDSRNVRRSREIWHKVRVRRVAHAGRQLSGSWRSFMLHKPSTDSHTDHASGRNFGRRTRMNISVQIHEHVLGICFMIIPWPNVCFRKCSWKYHEIIIGHKIKYRNQHEIIIGQLVPSTKSWTTKISRTFRENYDEIINDIFIRVFRPIWTTTENFVNGSTMCFVGCAMGSEMVGADGC